MKKLIENTGLTLVVLLVSLSTFSQGIVGMPEYNVLFHGYDNSLEIGFDQGNQNLTLKVEGATLVKTQKGYIVRPLKGSKYAEIIGVLSNGDTIIQQGYRCMSLPNPDLYWGLSMSGQVARSEENLLFVKWHPSWTLDDKFSIQDWEVTIGKGTVKGKGNLLSSAVQDLIIAQKSNTVQVSISATYYSESNKILKKVSGIYSVENNLNTEIPENQSVYIIDKDESTKGLFDENDPFSLIGLIKANCLSDVNYMSYTTQERLVAFETSMNKTIVYDENPSPLTDADGNPIIDTFPDGTQGLRYPGPEEILYDISEISRFVIYRSTQQDPISKKEITSVTHIGLAKKYPGNDKYDVVLKIPFATFLSGNFGQYKQIDAPSALKIIENSNVCADDSDAKNYMFLMPNFFSFSTFDSIRDLAALSHIRYPFVNSTLEHYYTYGDIAHLFDSVKFVLGEQSNFPLVDEFGDPIITINALGVEEYVFPPADTLVCFLEASPKNVSTYFKYKAMELRGGHFLVPVELVYTVNTQNGKYAYSIVDILKLPSHYYEKYPFLKEEIDVNELAWKKIVMSKIEMSKAYSLSKKKDIKALDKEFNLDEGVFGPDNLLNVCVGCK